VVARHQLAARKGLGQHFLFDRNLTDRIVRAAFPLEGRSVLEVGPGPGGLTRSLLASPAARIVAIERDSRCLAALGELTALAGDRLHVISGDALEIGIDDAVLAQLPAPRWVIANLPYNVATPLLIGWLRRLEAFEGLVLMFQKEVAERITARPGTDAYGRLSVLCRWRGRPEYLFSIPAQAFVPPPRVVSAVVRLTPRLDPEPASWPVFERVTATAFGQRRKMMRSALRALGDSEALLAAAGIPPTVRAEELDESAFAALARALAAVEGDGICPDRPA